MKSHVLKKAYIPYDIGPVTSRVLYFCVQNELPTINQQLIKNDQQKRIFNWVKKALNKNKKYLDISQRDCLKKDVK